MNTAYLTLKTAQSLFGKAPRALNEAEMQQVNALVARQSRLEIMVLAAKEARDVMVPSATLNKAVAEIQGRYDSEGEFLDDLGNLGLSLTEFKQSLERELKVDGVLEKVGSNAVKVSDIDVELYYHYHPEQFQRPETRRVRHILITINDQYPENSRTAARERIQAIADRLKKDPDRFAEQAMKHSECPTSMQGGLMGDVPKGKLYPELDASLFDLAPGKVSEILESELGFHILLCEAIQPAQPVPLSQARKAIQTMLDERRKTICQKAWLKQLQTDKGRHPSLS